VLNLPERGGWLVLAAQVGWGSGLHLRHRSRPTPTPVSRVSQRRCLGTSSQSRNVWQQDGSTGPSAAHRPFNGKQLVSHLKTSRPSEMVLETYQAPRWTPKRRSYPITSSARASSVGGKSRPSVLAVPRLTTRSNLVGCSTGRSAGLAPLRIRSTK